MTKSKESDVLKKLNVERTLSRIYGGLLRKIKNSANRGAECKDILQHIERDDTLTTTELISNAYRVNRNDLSTMDNHLFVTTAKDLMPYFATKIGYDFTPLQKLEDDSKHFEQKLIAIAESYIRVLASYICTHPTIDVFVQMVDLLNLIGLRETDSFLAIPFMLPTLKAKAVRHRQSVIIFIRYVLGHRFFASEEIEIELQTDDAIEDAKLDEDDLEFL